MGFIFLGHILVPPKEGKCTQCHSSVSYVRYMFSSVTVVPPSDV